MVFVKTWTRVSRDWPSTCALGSRSQIRRHTSCRTWPEGGIRTAATPGRRGRASPPSTRSSWDSSTHGLPRGCATRWCTDADADADADTAAASIVSSMSWRWIDERLTCFSPQDPWPWRQQQRWGVLLLLSAEVAERRRRQPPKPHEND